MRPKVVFSAINGDLTLQIGTAYFGCRDGEGPFDLDRLMRVVESARPKAIEIMDGNRRGTPLRVVYGYQARWGAPGPRIRDEVIALMSRTASSGGDAPVS